MEPEPPPPIVTLTGAEAARLEATEHMVAEIHTALLGYGGSGGLIAAVRALDLKQHAFEETLAEARGAGRVLGVFWGVIGASVVEALVHIVTHG